MLNNDGRHRLPLKWIAMPSSRLMSCQMARDFSTTEALPGPVYYKGETGASLCLRATFLFLALVRNDVTSWDETTYPPFYQERPSQTTTTPKPTSVQRTSSDFFSDNSFISTIWPIFLVVMLVIAIIGEETLPAYNQTHEMNGIVSTSTPATRTAESNATQLVSSRTVSVARSVTPSEVLSPETWSVEEVAGWVRLNGAGLSGAEKVRTLQMDGGMLKQLTVEEILQVFSLEDESERDKLREALTVLKITSQGQYVRSQEQ
ncbi:hypothetical protein BJ741DRAFT_662726 [Chytriomyces cf. hyalinus JEL632]|nr:hypothetical protein BJ741DRAFT_662726 [Chytriomyces cf. hyalinus JEL632]